MFAMVLAIGLLVDDAIVVVENVERVMAEEGLSPLEATRKSMDQITGALVGIGLVLSAVFVPMAFFPGSAGVIYKQFSITIVSAMALSVIVALVLTPALCATMLKPIEKGHSHEKKGFFGWFNRKFDASNARYQGAVGRMLHKSGRYLIIYGGLLAVTAFMFTRLPTSFLPDEDQGVFFTQVQLPAGATQEQTLQVLAKMEDYFLNEEGENVKSLFTVAGFSFSGTGQNSGIGFVRLRDWSERPGKENSAAGIVQRASKEFASWPEAQAFAFAPPAIRELGNASGFNLFIQDRTGLGRDALIQARNTMIGEAAKNPILTGVRPNATADTPQYQLDIDNAKAGALGVTVSEISDTLTSAWGGSFINDFLDRGRVKRVYMQADAPFRMLPEDLNRFYVRNSDGEMVPFSNFSSAEWSMASPRLERYNGLPAVEIQGQAAPGMSSGDAMDAMEAIAENLPEGMGIEWTGLSYEERQSGSQAPLLYALSLLIVFLCLAALYESWSIPFAVMLIVPLGVVGALLAASGRGLANDVYFQVALLTTVGLSAKNAILIVEFAKEQFDQGRDLLEATLDAVRMRLRPIIMTSLAFGLGVVPLAISTGAGSGSQNAIGTGVLGGTISATVLGIFFVPMFFVVVTRLFGKNGPRKTPLHRENDMNKIHAWKLTPVVLALALAGCGTLAPSYEQPAAPVASNWPQGEAYQADSPAAQAAIDLAWRDLFVDQRLEQLLELALKENRDLRIAALNIERARALYQVQRSDLFPTISADGEGNRQRLPADLSGGRSGGATPKQYSATVGFAAYELDLFGRVRSLNEEALQRFLATEEARKSTQISLIAITDCP